MALANFAGSNSNGYLHDTSVVICPVLRTSDLLMQKSPPMDSTEQALGFSPERDDPDADAANWVGVAPATSYANAGEMYGEEEVEKTVVSTRINSGISVYFISSA